VSARQPVNSSFKIHRERDGQVVVGRCRLAATFISRLRGWMFTDPVASDQGLLLNPCNDIHMGFMRFPIDAVFLVALDQPASRSTRFEVTSIRSGLRPWKLIPVRDGRAQATLELPEGAASRSGLAPGEVLICSN
jgi:uncharacterized membrane protein (UPF0127 family)